MLVTIIADASYCPQHKVAGYGYWIVSDRGSSGGGGPLAKGLPVHNSTVSEMMAIANALYVALKEGYATINDHILIQTDCIAAIDAFTFKRTNLNEHESIVVKTLNQYMLQYSLNFRFKHVKGHTNNKQARFVTNNICDERARSEMKKLRKLVLKGNRNDANP